MIPTLEINDRVVATKFTYQIGEPERGDVVVFKYPVNEEQGIETVIYVKRCIGLPGETLEIKTTRSLSTARRWWRIISTQARACRILGR